MTHAELVSRGARWLRSRGYQTILTRGNVVTTEIPDVVAWKASAFSCVIECKASRADFLRDADKPHRVCPNLGVGYRRYFMAPAKMLKAEEVPEGWGLLDAHPWKIIEVKPSAAFVNRNLRTELQLALVYARKPELLTVPDLDPECLFDAGL